MKAPSLKKREARLPVKVKRAQSLQAAQQLKVAKPNSERQVVEHLQAVLADIDRLPLLTGALGCQALDCFELVAKIREKYRDKARALLLEQPGAITNWHASETPQRVLSKDAQEVFDALASADDTLTPERFLEACSVSLTAIRKLLAARNPQWNADQVEVALNNALSAVIQYESICSLSRSKDRQLNLNLDDGER